MNRFVRLGFTAALVGGLVLALGAGLGLLGTSQPLSTQATTSAFVVSSGLRLLGAFLMLLGIAAVSVRQADHAGRFGLVAYVLATANMVLQLGWMWSDTFLSGAVAKHAPGILDGTIDDGRLSVAFMSAWLMNAAFVLLGIAVLRAHVFTRFVGWALIVTGAITLVPLPFDGPVYEVAIGIAFASAAVGLRRTPYMSPAPAPAATPSLLGEPAA
jgi:hypothetical protein